MMPALPRWLVEVEGKSKEKNKNQLQKLVLNL